MNLLGIAKLFSRRSKEKEEEGKAAEGCYKADINCENCHFLLEFELPKSQTVLNYCAGLVCPNCGCFVYELLE